LTSKLPPKCLARAAGAIALAAAVGAQAMDNPLARGAFGTAPSAPIDGAWNGTDLERRSNCTNAQNDGNRGTYAEFDATTDPLGHAFAIDQKGITGLNCTYFGTYSGSSPVNGWVGTYSCTDGKHGTFTSRSILVTENALSVHLDVRLDTTETCTIEAVIGAGRLYP
jgi:hypothetical protein